MPGDQGAHVPGITPFFEREVAGPAAQAELQVVKVEGQDFAVHLIGAAKGERREAPQVDAVLDLAPAGVPTLAGCSAQGGAALRSAGILARGHRNAGHKGSSTPAESLAGRPRPTI